MARSAAQSALRYPLTRVLGSEGSVRVLRELAQHGGQLSAPALVHRTQLAQSSVREALILLERLDAVEAIGSGRARLFHVREAYPLADALTQLFAAERQRFDAILEAIARAARSSKGVHAAWIYGSVARAEDGVGSDLDIAFVADPAMLEAAKEAMQIALHAAEEEQGFRASVLALDTADVFRLEEEQDPWWSNVIRDAIAVFGDRPEVLSARIRRFAMARRKAS